MTDELAPTSHVIVLDSLSANEFAVEIDGERVAGVLNVSGLTPFKLDVKPALTKLVYEPFRLTKAVQRDPALPFNVWVRATINAKDDIDRPKRTLTVIAIDEGEEIRRWVFKNAWIGEVRYSDFDSGRSELVQETIVIYYDGVDVTWYGE